MGRRAKMRVWVGAVVWVAAGAACGMAQAGGPSEELPDAPEAGQVTPQATGTVLGVVVDTAGALISGAEVRVQDANGGETGRVTTGGDGRYRLEGIPAGPFTLTVQREGFRTATGTGELSSGGTFEAAAIALAPAEVQTTVDAMTEEQVAEQQIHLQEQQRLIGILPNFFVSYVWNAAPLKTHQKFELAWKNAIDPGNVLVAGITAGIQQATNGFPGYGQGLAGYGRRLGGNYGDIVSGTFLGGAVFPTLFHQDPRFFVKQTGSGREKLWYAVTRAVVQRGDNGRWQPAYSSVAGDFAAGALSNAYYAPEDRQGIALTLKNGGLGILGDAVNGVVQEFVLPYFTTRGKLKP